MSPLAASRTSRQLLPDLCGGVSAKVRLQCRQERVNIALPNQPSRTQSRGGQPYAFAVWSFQAQQNPSDDAGFAHASGATAWRQLLDELRNRQVRVSVAHVFRLQSRSRGAQKNAPRGAIAKPPRGALRHRRFQRQVPRGASFRASSRQAPTDGDNRSPHPAIAGPGPAPDR